MTRKAELSDQAIETRNSRTGDSRGPFLSAPSHQQPFLDQQPFLFTDDQERSWVEFLAAKGSNPEVTADVASCSETHLKVLEAQPKIWLRDGVQKITEKDQLIEIASSRVCTSFSCTSLRISANILYKGQTSVHAL